MDRLNLNLIPHPEEDDHLRHFSWKTDEDAILVYVRPFSNIIDTPSPQLAVHLHRQWE